MKRIFSLAIPIALCTTSLSADDIYLRDGQVLRGVISVRNQNGYLVISKDGRTRGLRKDEVRKIEVKKVRWQAADQEARRKMRADLDRLQEQMDRTREALDAQAGTVPDAFPLGMRALVPGLVQYSSGERGRGLALATGFVLSALGYAGARDEYRRIRNRRQDPGPPLLAHIYGGNNWHIYNTLYFRALNRRLRSAARQTNALATTTVGLYGYSYLDALSTGRQKPSAGQSAIFKRGNRGVPTAALILEYTIRF